MEPELPPPNLEANLSFQDGKSDKVYQLKVAACTGGYVVNYAYGRRGSKLRTGAKNGTPLSLVQATMLFNQIVAAKTGEGYLPAKDGPALNGLMQNNATRGTVLGAASQLQTEIWSRNYGHSWGLREEWATLLSEHPEVLELSDVKEAADVILSNLAQWSPDLAAKERKARACWCSPEERAAASVLMDRALATLFNRAQIGPAIARVSIGEVDSNQVPEVRPGTWLVLSDERVIQALGTRDSAVQRANELVEKMSSILKFSATIDPHSSHFEIRGDIIPRDSLKD